MGELRSALGTDTPIMLDLASPDDHAITLAVASALEVPVVRDGHVVVGREMKLTLACDHRIIDGAQAARFLHDLVVLLENTDELLK